MLLYVNCFVSNCIIIHQQDFHRGSINKTTRRRAMRVSIATATLGWLGCVLFAAPRAAWAFAPDGGRRSLRPPSSATFPCARCVGGSQRGPPFVARGAARFAVVDGGDTSSSSSSSAAPAASPSSAAPSLAADAARRGALAVDEAVGARDRWAGARLLAKVFDANKPFEFLAVLCWPGILPNVFFEVGDGGDSGAAQSVWLARDADDATGDAGAAGDVIGVVQLVPVMPRSPAGDETRRNVVWMQARTARARAPVLFSRAASR